MGIPCIQIRSTDHKRMPLRSASQIPSGVNYVIGGSGCGGGAGGGGGGDDR